MQYKVQAHKPTTKRYLWYNWENVNTGWILYDIKRITIRCDNGTVVTFFKSFLQINIEVHNTDKVISRTCF